ncbi:MAG TPA: hypothetical protein VJK03_01575 [Candidatus Nanoarchaeia archaeon]|nr:hypothetical protein [Candidatus Nanoarchaeia archaeon]
MFTPRELTHALIAILVLAIVISFQSLIRGSVATLVLSLAFAALIIIVNIGSKKIAAHILDADVEHELWFWSRYGFKPGWYIKPQIPLGVIIPLFFTAFSIGIIKCMTLLTYETAALKRRAARRFGFYSFTEMTDWHNSLIGAAGIIGVLLLAIAGYGIPGLEGLPTLAVYYAFWNLIPFSKLDGTHILFGSKVIYTALALVTLVMLLATFVIV